MSVVYPKATVSWAHTPSSYVKLSYYGNTTATSATITSSNLTGESTTTADLSSNDTYVFSLTPYSRNNTAGKIQSVTFPTTPLTTTTPSKSNVQLQWVGAQTSAAVSRASAAGVSSTFVTYEDISTNITQTYYYDLDLSGNTSYSYIVKSYNELGNFIVQCTVNLYTAIQPAYNLAAAMVDTSSIRVSFTVPKNSYSTSAIYTLRATAADGTYKDATGTTTPIQVRDLSDAATYTCKIITTLDGSTEIDSSGTVQTTTNTIPTITSITTAALYDTSAQFLVDGSFAKFILYHASAPYINKTYTPYVAGGITTGIRDISGLLPNAAHTFTLTPYNTQNFAANATTYTITTLPQISKFIAAGYDTSAIQLTFDGSYSAATLSWYSSVDETVNTRDISPPLKTSMVDGLSQGVSYYFTMNSTGSTGLASTTATSTGYTKVDISGMVFAAVGYGIYVKPIEMSGNIYTTIGYGAKSIYLT